MAFKYLQCGTPHNLPRQPVPVLRASWCSDRSSCVSVCAYYFLPCHPVLSRVWLCHPCIFKYFYTLIGAPESPPMGHDPVSSCSWLFTCLSPVRLLCSGEPSTGHVLQVPHQCQAEGKDHFHPSLGQPPFQQGQCPWAATQAATLKLQEILTTSIKSFPQNPNSAHVERLVHAMMWQSHTKQAQAGSWVPGHSHPVCPVKPLLTPLRAAPQRIPTALGMEEFEQCELHTSSLVIKHSGENWDRTE